MKKKLVLKKRQITDLAEVLDKVGAGDCPSGSFFYTQVGDSCTCPPPYSFPNCMP
jgi:hypothetical protein